jgi:hypothetical protein
LQSNNRLFSFTSLAAFQEETWILTNTSLFEYMNLHRHSHSFDRISASTLSFSDAYRHFPTNIMQPLTSAMSSSPHDDPRNVSDDRINTDERSRFSSRGGLHHFLPDGPGLVFDEDRAKTPVEAKQLRQQDWQARSPDEDGKQSDLEPRNPSSPPKDNTLSTRHERQFSEHFFDATTLSPREGSDADDPTVDSALRKHRRIFSGDMTNPPLAHRRTNSIGKSAAVVRRHHRVDSAGLDILSAAVTGDEMSAVEGSSRLLPQAHLSYDTRMHPPEHRRGTAYPTQQQYALRSADPSTPYQMAVQSASGSSLYPPYHHYHQQQQHPIQHQQIYPAQYSQRPAPSFKTQQHHYHPQRPEAADRFYNKDAASHPRSEWNTNMANHQGSQTFVTAIAVGPGNRAVMPKDDAPSYMGHHRKMSSLSSLGPLLGSNIFSPDHSLRSQFKKATTHHRHTSSSISFLPGLEGVGLDSTDDTFLRNLQAANSGAVTEPKPGSPVSSQDILASGGTSKRVRRKCNMQGCANRVVQGGLCISHGARRKICNHAGCNKNVKKAGLCSTHGPARRRCDIGSCGKVAVQGGRCIAHGAKKRMCAVDNCTKQAILLGKCKKHHDISSGICSEIASSQSSDKPTHTRGLSIFQEMSADAVQSILLEDGTEGPNPSAADDSSGNVW